MVHLRWGSHIENMADKLRDGTDPRGEKCGGSKLTENQVQEIRRVYARGGVSMRAIGTQYEVSYAQIQNIISGRRWSWLPSMG